jgi:hypothetical protein
MGSWVNELAENCYWDHRKNSPEITPGGSAIVVAPASSTRGSGSDLSLDLCLSFSPDLSLLLDLSHTFNLSVSLEQKNEEEEMKKKEEREKKNIREKKRGSGGGNLCG